MVNKSYNIKKTRKRWLNYFVLIGIGTCILLSSIALTLALQPEAKAKKYVGPYLIVQEVYFVLATSEEDIADSQTTIDMYTFITNIGDKDAERVEVRAFAIDKESNLGVCDTKTTIGVIGKETTSEAHMALELTNSKTYRIELLVFESGKIVVRGCGTVKLIGSTGNAGEDFRTTASEPEGVALAKEECEEKKLMPPLARLPSKSSSLIVMIGIIFFILILIIVLIIIVKRREKQYNRPSVKEGLNCYPAYYLELQQEPRPINVNDEYPVAVDSADATQKGS